MKLVKVLEITAVIGVTAFAFAALFGTHASETIAIATIPFVLASFCRDYSPRQSRWEPARPPVRFLSTHRPLRRMAQKVTA